MEKYQQAAVCFAGSKYIDKDGNVLSCDMNKWKSAIPPYAVFNGETYAEHNLYWRGYIANASSAIFRKSMVNAQIWNNACKCATAATGCSGFIWQCKETL